MNEKQYIISCFESLVSNNDEDDNIIKSSPPSPATASPSFPHLYTTLDPFLQSFAVSPDNKAHSASSLSPSVQQLRHYHEPLFLPPSDSVSLVLETSQSKSRQECDNKTDNLLVHCYETAGSTTTSTAVKSNGLFPTNVDEEGNGALHAACLAGNVASLNELLQKSSVEEWICSQNGCGLTPLMIATTVGSLECVESILNFAASHPEREFKRSVVNACTTHGCTALHIAIDEGHLHVAKALIEHGEAFVTTRAAVTITHSTSVQLHPGSLRVAVSLPAIERLGVTPIELAILRGVTPADMKIFWAALRTTPSNGMYDFTRPQTDDHSTKRKETLMTAKEKRAMAQALAVDAEPIRDCLVIRSFLEDMGKTFSDTDVDDIARILESDLFSRAESSRLDVILLTNEIGITPQTTTTNKQPLSGHDNQHSRMPSFVHEVSFTCGSEQPSPNITQLETLLTQTGFSSAFHWLLSHTAEGSRGLRAADRSMFFGADQCVLPLAVHPTRVHEVLASAHIPQHAYNVFDASQLYYFCCKPFGYDAHGPCHHMFVGLTSSCPSEQKQTSSVCFVAHALTFQSHFNVARSLFECNAVRSVLNVENAAMFAFHTQDRFLVDIIRGTANIAPYNSLFQTFRESIVVPLAQFRLPSTFSALEASVNGFDLAIRQQEDAMVMFFTACPTMLLQHDHLILAATHGTSATFQLLFAAMGSSVELLTRLSARCGEHVVSAAIRSRRCTHLSSLLRVASRDLERVNHEGLTPLLLSCLYGNESATLQLISLGADVNKPGSNGLTPLIAAICGPMESLSLVLMRNGAYGDVADRYGLTPLMAAEYYSSSAEVSLCHAQLLQSAGSTTIHSPVPNGSSVKDRFSSPLQEAAMLLHSIECHLFHLRSSGLAVPYSRKPILQPWFDLPVRPHAILPMNADRLNLYRAFCRMLKSMTLFFRAALLVPHLFYSSANESNHAPRRGGGDVAEGTVVMSAEECPFVDVTMDVFVRRLRTFVTERLPQYPIGEVETDELMATVERFQKITLLSQRIAALVRHRVEPWKLTTESVMDGRVKDIWLAATQASKNGPLAPVARVDQVLLSLIGHVSCPLLSESSSLQDVIVHLLDPARTGLTTLIEFDTTSNLIAQFSDEGLSSLHYLWMCRSVVLLQCAEVASWRLKHVEAGYIVSIGPCAVTVYRQERQHRTSSNSSSSSPSLAMGTQQTYNVVELVSRFSETLQPKTVFD